MKPKQQATTTTLSSTADLKKHLEMIQSSQKRSSQLLTRFQAALDDISVRANRVTTDVTKYHVAWRNLSATERELRVAKECYTIPSYIEEVVTHGNRSVPTMCRALERLVQTKAYLDEKPFNELGERLDRNVTSQMNKLVEIFERQVLAAVLEATTLPKADHASTGNGRKHRAGDATGGANPSAPLTIGGGIAATAQPQGNNPGHSDTTTATNSISPKLLTDEAKISETYKLTSLLLFHFRRDDVCQEIKNMFTDCIVNYIEDSVALAQFDEKLAAKARGTSASMGTAAEEAARRQKSYRKGRHVMIKLSIHGRRMIEEASKVIELVVLKACNSLRQAAEKEKRLGDGDETTGTFRYRGEDEDGLSQDDDAQQSQRQLVMLIEELHLLPAELCLAVADKVFSECAKVLSKNATNPDCSLHTEIFVALDLLEELWQWRPIARRLPGNTEGLTFAIDDLVDGFAEEVKTLLTDYQHSKGQLDQTELEQAVALNRIRYDRITDGFMMLLGIHTTSEDEDLSELFNEHPIAIRKWMPQLDCSAHQTTVSLVNFFSQVLSPNFEACLRIALQGSTREVDRMLKKADEQRIAAKRAGQTKTSHAARSDDDDDDDNARGGFARRGPLSLNGGTFGQLAGINDAATIDFEADLWQEEVLNYLSDLVTGHMFDLESIGKATARLVNRSLTLFSSSSAREGGRHRRTGSVGSLSSSASSSQPSEYSDAEEDDDGEGGELVKLNEAKGPGQQRFSVPIFMANNAQCITSAVKSNPVFRSAHGVVIADAILDVTENERETYVAAYGERWKKILPPIPPLGHDELLTHDERMSLKHWHRDACAALEAEFNTAQEQYVDPALRFMLAEAAATNIREVFDEKEYLVDDREWSQTPEKWMTFDLDDLQAHFVRVFAGR